ncbi:MAG: glutamine-hydrolyzing carbamoyl-phosphate synthase small subunit [Alphaproteobacteria bacterium]|nr:glutamine-hydrolyzing carbamoyl-phosphate synthase small subunit [Alphaproteobacteria bacterium]
MAKATPTPPTARARSRQGGVVPPPASSPAKPLSPVERLDFATRTRPADATAALVLADGTVFWGRGFGAGTVTVGEVCFNTSMTGYQEILTDPSYAGQIITFTFPHIGNTGANPEDIETMTPAARGLVVRANVTEPASWRAAKHLEHWLLGHGLPGIGGIDTRALTARIRDAGAPSGALQSAPQGALGTASGAQIDIGALHRMASEWPGLEGMDLAREVTCHQTYSWDETRWQLGKGYGALSSPRFKVVAVDYGAKHNILRCLASLGCAVTVVPAETSAADILRHNPDGIFLSNGPGDPAATGRYAVPAIRELFASGKPVFGICLGHRLLGLALGAKTRKMAIGHRGANHPVKDLATGKVEITSQNHGFVVLDDSLPAGVEKTHVSLFDGSLEGLRVKDKPVFSVQYHPEASPGPQDSHYLFERFVAMMEKKQ